MMQGCGISSAKEEGYHSFFFISSSTTTAKIPQILYN